MKINVLFWKKKKEGKISAFLGDVLRVFQTPFIGLPLVVWCYFVIAYMALPFNAVWQGNLPDSDDYTYLSQTLDWLQGQGWYDSVQHRMSPPEGVAIHYTRFAEMPIAAVIMMFRLFGYTWQGAGLLSSFVLPLVYLGLFFWVLRVVAERFVSKDWSRLAPFVALFAPHLMFKFAPGQVDHHGLLAILTVIALGLTTKIFESPRQIVWACAAGFVFAFSVATGLEVLPWMALTSAMLALWALLSGKAAAPPIIAFGLSLFASGAVFLALSRPISDIADADLLSYSIAYVVLMAGIAAVLVAVAATTLLSNVKARFVLSGIVAVALGIIYLNAFPALLAGPYGAMDQKLAALFFANLEEAVPMIERVGVIKALLYAVTIVIGVATSLFMAHKANDHKRWNWLLLALFLTTSVVLAFFYQIRLMIYAQLFSIIPLVAVASLGWPLIAKKYEGRRRFWAEIGLILLLGPLTVVFLPALMDSRSFNVGVLLFSAQSVDNSCDIRRISGVLKAPPYGDKKLRIMNMIGEGAGLIYYTPHEVMSAPYHTNVRGNMDSLDFFSTTVPSEARQIATRDGIDLVVLCHYVPTMYLRNQKPQTEHTLSPQSDETFAVQLIRRQTPFWLTRVPLKGIPNFSLFEVKDKRP